MTKSLKVHFVYGFLWDAAEIAATVAISIFGIEFEKTQISVMFEHANKLELHNVHI